jgi:hypothetical protein
MFRARHPALGIPLAIARRVRPWRVNFVVRAQQQWCSMNWYDVTDKYQAQTFPHDCRLSSLPEEWQRELAAIGRLEADVNNGAYLQFFSNWGRETYIYASQALRKIGARKMAEIIDRCQALVDEHFDSENASYEQMRNLRPNTVIGLDGTITKNPGGILPNWVVNRIYELSYEFMRYPEDLAQLGLKHYRPYIESDWRG